MFAYVIANLRWRRARTWLTASGTAVGVAAIVALLALTTGLERSAAGLLHIGDARFALFQGSSTDLTASAIPQQLVARVRAVPGVLDATPIQVDPGLVAAEPSMLVFGIAPGGFIDRRLVLVAGRRARRGELLVGDGAARDLGVRPGATLRLKGRPFRVAGVYHTGVGYQDAGAALDIADAQALVKRRREVTSIAVLVDAGVRTAPLARRIERAFPGLAALTEPSEVARADTNSRLVNKAAAVIAVLAIAIGVIAMTNTMLMGVLERSGELALLSAVGWSRRRVSALVVSESLGLGLLGGAVGIVLGVAGGTLLVHAFAAQAFVVPVHTAAHLLGGLAVAAVIGAAGSLYPAWRATRLSPAEALHRE